MDPIEDIIHEGCTKNDVAEVTRGIEAMTLRDGPGIPRCFPLMLNAAIHYRAFDVVRYLLDKEIVPTDAVRPCEAAQSESIEMLQILLDHGWDINRSEPGYDEFESGRRPLQYMYDESLIRWCLDHGAYAKDPYPNPYISPPVLDLVAQKGTIPAFELLRSRGAEIGIRTLHRAVEGAAWSEPETRSVRMEMLKHLILTVGLDVNALDCERQEFNHYGTPLNYALQTPGPGQEEVVRFLMDQGADPFKFKPEFLGMSPMTYAKLYNKPMLKLISDLMSHEENQENEENEENA